MWRAETGLNLYFVVNIAFRRKSIREIASKYRLELISKSLNFRVDDFSIVEFLPSVIFRDNIDSKYSKILRTSFLLNDISELLHIYIVYLDVIVTIFVVGSTISPTCNFLVR